MPYVSRPIYRQVEWGLDTVGGAPAVDSIASDMGPFSCVIPTYTGVIISAYMDINLGTLINTHAGLNTLANTQYIQIKNNGGTYANAIKFIADTFQTNVSPNNVISVGRVYGSYDIATKIQAAGSGGTIVWKWANAQSTSDDLIFRGAIQPIIRVVFR